jgi:hypothetical protein
MLCEDSEVFFLNVRFEGNRDTSSESRGGGLCCSSGATVVLSGCEFVSNEVGREEWWGNWGHGFTGHGGGLCAMWAAHVTVEDGVFRENFSWSHGAGACALGDYTELVLRRCTFDSNTAPTYLDLQEGGRGGGLCVESATADIRDTELVGNSVGLYGGAIYANALANLTLDGVTISDCEAGVSGGALFAQGPVEFTFTDVHFIANRASAGGAAYFDAGLRAREFRRCLFVSNTAHVTGGAIHAWASYSGVLVTQCTMYGNAAPSGSQIHAAHAASPVIENSILTFGFGGEPIACLEGSVPQVTNCCVFGHDAGDSLCGDYSENIFADPLFCSCDGGDFSLCENSPCLAQGAGDDPIGAFGQGCGPCSSATERTSWGAIKATYRTE